MWNRIPGKTPKTLGGKKSYQRGDKFPPGSTDHSESSVRVVSGDITSSSRDQLFSFDSVSVHPCHFEINSFTLPLRNKRQLFESQTSTSLCNTRATRPSLSRSQERDTTMGWFWADTPLATSSSPIGHPNLADFDGKTPPVCAAPTDSPS